MNALGFDFGTRGSAIAYFQDGDAVPIMFEKQPRLATAVYISPGTNVKIFGKGTESHLYNSPSHVLSVSGALSNLGRPVLKTINGIHFSTSDLVRELLAFMHRKVETKLKGSAKYIVSTLPSCFNKDQRRDLQKAVAETGLTLCDIIPSAYAAAVAFAHERERESRLLVLDAGISGFDVVLAKMGLGRAEFKAGSSGKFDEISDLHNEQAIETTQEEMEEIGEKIKQVLKNKNWTMELVDDFLLVGERSQDPILLDWLEKKFKKPVFGDAPETCSARGAAIHCYRVLSGEVKAMMPQEIPAKVISRSIGIEMYLSNVGRTQLVHVLKRNTRYPARGAIFGSTQAGQNRLRFRIFQGEDIDTIPRNKLLGELIFDIQTQNVAASNGVAVVFHLDEFQRLTFIAVEIPYSKDLIEDTQFQRIVEFSDRYDSVIPFTELDALMRKYDFYQQQMSFNLA